MKNITAIILAAGYGSRMGEFKPLLSIGGMTLLERNIRLFESAGIQDIRVVAGYRASDILAMLQPMRVFCIVNEAYDQGMFTSVIAGIRTLPPSQKAFFILPADIPMVRPGTLTALLNAYQKTEIVHPILYPNFQGRRGHPPLIDSGYVSEIFRWNKTGGLRAFLENYEAYAADVAVADQGILSDLDTPEDYHQMLEQYNSHDIPTPQACEAIMSQHHVPEPIIQHCQAVAKVAVCIGEALIQAGCQVNLNLIRAGALLHDLAKGYPHHAALGEQRLNEMGYPAVAEIVGAHADMDIQEQSRISEKEVVHLADKLVMGKERVSLESRFQAKRRRYQNNPQASAGVERRFRNAMKMEMRVVSETGRSLEAIFAEPDLLPIEM